MTVHATTTAADGTGFELDRDDTLRLPGGARGLVVRADRGTVLVTREGDPDDHVVEPGAALEVTGKGLVVAWALTRAAIRVERKAA